MVIVGSIAHSCIHEYPAGQDVIEGYWGVLWAVDDPKQEFPLIKGFCALCNFTRGTGCSNWWRELIKYRVELMGFLIDCANCCYNQLHVKLRRVQWPLDTRGYFVVMAFVPDFLELEYDYLSTKKGIIAWFKSCNLEGFCLWTYLQSVASPLCGTKEHAQERISVSSQIE